MVQLLTTLLMMFTTRAFAAEVQFEGYYRLELDKKPIGYVIQRYEVEPKEKIMRSAYFLKTNEVGGNIQESLKAETSLKKGEEFSPLTFQYTGQTGATLKSIDGTFKEQVMNITRIEGKTQKKETYRIPKKTFLSTFLPYQMLSEGIKTGTNFTYSAVAEEDGNSYKGVASVIKEDQFEGQMVYRVENKFKGEEFVSFITPKGEMLATNSEKKKLTLRLVKKPSEATEGFTVPNKSILLTFGNVPSGKANVFSRQPASEPAHK